MKQIFYGIDGVAVAAELEGKILFIRQYRKSADKYLLELPGGAVDAGELIEKAAVREFEEETGLIPLNLRYLASFYSNPGISTNKIHLFFANEVELGKIDQEMETLLLSKEEIESTIFEDAKTIICLLMLGYNLKFSKTMSG